MKGKLLLFLFLFFSMVAYSTLAFDGPKVGDTLEYDLAYAGMPLGFLKAKAVSSRNTEAGKVIRLNFDSNVSQLDKSEEIDLLLPACRPVFFKQVFHDGRTQTTTFDLATSPVYDPISLLYFLRRRDWKTPVDVALVDQRLRFVKDREESLMFQGKSYSTMVVKSEPALLTLWFTTDSNRVPLQIQYDLFMGSVVLVLKEN
jgi:hypothetical protein